MPYKEGKKWRGKVQREGKRYTKLFGTKKEALDWESSKREILKMMEIRTATALAVFYNLYLNYSEKHHSRNTYIEKKKLSKRFMAFYPKIMIHDVTPEKVLKYLHAQVDSRSTNAYNKDRKNLLALFNFGQQFYGLKFNPVSRIPIIRHEPASQYVPSTEDVLKILAVATRADQVFLDCYLNTAARRSEIFRWTWHEDINFDRRQVRLGTRKTRDGAMSYEWVEMNDVLYESLWWHWNNRPVKNTPYVFVCVQPGPWYGQPYTQRRRFMAGLCDRAGVRPFGFHALRRYVASYLADEKKVSAKRIQRVLRHKNVYTTERYIKNINRDMKDTYEMLSDFYSEEKGTKQRHENKEVAP